MVDSRNEQYGVDNPEIKKLLNDLAHLLGDQMPKGCGFTLLLFSYGEGGDLFYISSAQRDDMLRTMAEFIQKRGN